MKGHKQFFLFVAAGGASAIVNLVCRFFLNFWMSFSPSVLLAYLCGMATAYMLNRVYVFERSGKPIADELPRFMLVNLAGALQVWGISVLLADYVFPRFGIVRFRLEAAHIIGVSVPVFTSYLGYKYFSFARSAENEYRKTNAN